ncbi:hypothetical protein RRG08_023642 [Elysia crispata]|uniref:Uncharacterized protein n=1 Tax=Elysia crispata TaxID=231223 RepID=A0AAE0XSV6_9GAST|nr:hypothetical protein RRG08_023642 [Elysia crispata]
MTNTAIFSTIINDQCDSWFTLATNEGTAVSGQKTTNCEKDFSGRILGDYKFAASETAESTSAHDSGVESNVTNSGGITTTNQNGDDNNMSHHHHSYDLTDMRDVQSDIISPDPQASHYKPLSGDGTNILGHGICGLTPGLDPRQFRCFLSSQCSQHGILFYHPGVLDGGLVGLRDCV